MTGKKWLILLISLLIMSIGPVNASQISGNSSSVNEYVQKTNETLNDIYKLNSSIQDDLKSLTKESKACKPKKVPWYVWLGAAADFWVIVIYLGVHLNRINSKSHELQDKLHQFNVTGMDLSGARYGLDVENQTDSSDISAESYEDYMQPKIENRTGYTLNSVEGKNLKIGDIVLYKSKNMYYRYLYVSKIDKKNGNYILRGMNNKLFVKSAADVDGNVKMRFNIGQNANNTQYNDLKVVNAAYQIQKQEFLDRRNSLTQLKDTSFELTQTTEWMRGTVNLVFDSVNVAIGWLSITGLPSIISLIKDGINFDIMMVNEYTFKPINNLAKDLLAYYDLEIPDLQEYSQSFVSLYPTAYDMNFTTCSVKNVTAEFNATGSSLLDYEITNNPESGNITLCGENGDHNGTFVYTPDPNFCGNVSFKYKATAGYDESNEATITIEVTPNHAPVASNMALNVLMNKNISAKFNVTDRDGDELDYRVVKPVHGNVSLNNEGTFVYTPENNYVGNDSFTYYVNDGFLNSKVCNANILVDNAPVAENMEFTLEKDKTLGLFDNMFNATDIDGDKLQFSVFKPKRGSLTDTESHDETWGTLTKYKNEWVYYPLKGFTGTVRLQYQAYDGVFWSNTANITVIYI